VVDLKDINWGSTPDIATYNQQQFNKFRIQSSEEIKKHCYDPKGRIKHVLKAEHFDLEFLRTICDTATAARRINKLSNAPLKSFLRSKSILNYFNQPSSRTFLSFSMAEAHLGMRREEVRDLKTSSTVKGESDRDSLRTISSYFDGIVCRHAHDDYDLFALWVMKSSDRELPIINAGSGTKEHPTQGILDYYTIRESFDDCLDRRVLLFVGDCKRGRTIHSLAKIMSLYQGMTMYFIAPQNLQIDTETEQYITQKGVNVLKTSEPLDKFVGLGDVIYMTRVQNEHGGEGEMDPRYRFTLEMLDSMRDGAILMHPLPKREEIDPRIDELKRDKRVMYWREERNGMWTRVGLLSYLFGVDDKIREYYQDIKNSVALKP